MKIKSIITILIIASVVLFSCKNKEVNVTRMEYPKCNISDTIIEHQYYSLKYSETHEQAIWVAYQLTSSETVPVVKRGNYFRTDPLVSTISSDKDDYYKSGYDRGHLAPAGDMAFDKIAQDESFYYSNVSPQLPGFNRGIWRGLEFRVRKWAVEFDSIYVVTGPILKKDLPQIGENNVSIPEYYFKAILVNNDAKKSAIGFIMPNMEGLENKYSNFTVCIDSIEKVTGLDLFPLLPNDIEESIESKLDMSFFGF